MNTISIIDLISIASSITSIVLALVAIFLSIFFYYMSDKANRSTIEAAKDIASSVEKLEKLFDRLYADTFSVMRDTYSDMRKHIWPLENSEQTNVNQEEESKAEKKISELQVQMQKRVSDILRQQALTEEKMAVVNKEMKQLIDKAIRSSRDAEVQARSETVREHILKILPQKHGHERLVIDEILERLAPSIPPSRTLNEIEKLRDEKKILLTPNTMAPDTKVTLR